MATLVKAFGTFSAFGVTTLSFFTEGGGIQRINSSLVRGERDKSTRDSTRAGRRSSLQYEPVVVLVARVVTVAAIIIGLVLLTRFLWSVASRNDNAHNQNPAHVCADVIVLD
jgi:hypothetical protein